jgi:hypothetical protein
MNPGTSALNPATITAHHAASHSMPDAAPAVLTSWKDIARYMGKGVRTVQRWEQDFGLPVRRPQGSNKKAVLARPRDLDAWVAMRCSSRAELAPNRSTSGASMDSFSSLACSMETARVLRNTNLALLGEVSASLEALRLEVQALSTNKSCGRSTVARSN